MPVRTNGQEMLVEERGNKFVFSQKYPLTSRLRDSESGGVITGGVITGTVVHDLRSQRMDIELLDKGLGESLTKLGFQLSNGNVTYSIQHEHGEPPEVRIHGDLLEIKIPSVMHVPFELSVENTRWRGLFDFTFNGRRWYEHLTVNDVLELTELKEEKRSRRK